jgi:hypothetical protein
MSQLVAHMYEQRGDMADVNGETKMPILVKKLLAPYVVHKGLGTSSLMAIG